MSFQKQKKTRQRRDYSSTKVKTRNLLTKVSYGRFKQTDFNKKNFIVDIMSFLTQNFNPINLDRKLDKEKECDIVKFLWDECIPHEFVCYIYTSKSYDVIGSPNLRKTILTSILQLGKIEKQIMQILVQKL